MMSFWKMIISMSSLIYESMIWISRIIKRALVRSALARQKKKQRPPAQLFFDHFPAAFVFSSITISHIKTSIRTCAIRSLLLLKFQRIQHMAPISFPPNLPHVQRSHIKPYHAINSHYILQHTLHTSTHINTHFIHQHTFHTSTHISHISTNDNFKSATTISTFPQIIIPNSTNSNSQFHKLRFQIPQIIIPIQTNYNSISIFEN